MGGFYNVGRAVRTAPRRFGQALRGYPVRALEAGASVGLPIERAGREFYRGLVGARPYAGPEATPQDISAESLPEPVVHAADRRLAGSGFRGAGANGEWEPGPADRALAMRAAGVHPRQAELDAIEAGYQADPEAFERERAGGPLTSGELRYQFPGGEWRSYNVGANRTDITGDPNFRTGGGYTQFRAEDVAYLPESVVEEQQRRVEYQAAREAVEDPYGVERALAQAEIRRRTWQDEDPARTEQLRIVDEYERRADKALLDEFKGDVEQARRELPAKEFQRWHQQAQQQLAADRERNTQMRLAIKLQVLGGGGGKDFLSALVPRPETPFPVTVP